jgi:hypothetical protein
MSACGMYFWRAFLRFTDGRVRVGWRGSSWRCFSFVNGICPPILLWMKFTQN